MTTSRSASTARIVTTRYVTLFDAYHSATDPDLLGRQIAEGEELLEPGDYLRVAKTEYVETPELAALDHPRIEHTDEIKVKLESLKVPYAMTTLLQRLSAEADEQHRREQFDAAVRWLNQDWMLVEPKPQTLIVAGVSVFLSLFDDHPAGKMRLLPARGLLRT